MAATLCAKLFSKQGWLPLSMTVRRGSKAVTRHKKPLHILKRKLLAVTTYMPPPRAHPPDAYPMERKPVEEEENGLVFLIKNDIKRIFQEQRMIAVVQNCNSNSEDLLDLRHKLFKHGIHLKSFPNKIMHMFLNSSPYHNMLPLFIGPTVLLVSEEPKVRELLSSLKRSPQMTLLGACIDNTLLSVQGIVDYSKLPSMTVAQGELVGRLTMLTSSTASMLQRHPAHLTALLQQHVKQQSPDAGAEAAPKAEEST